MDYECTEIRKNQLLVPGLNYMRTKIKVFLFLPSLHFLFPIVLQEFREKTFTTIWETLSLSQIHVVMQLGCLGVRGTTNPGRFSVASFGVTLDQLTNLTDKFGFKEKEKVNS